MIRYSCILFVLLALQLPAPAQISPEEAKIRKQCASALQQFASYAMGRKVKTRAKQAWEEILVYYDPDYRRARKELGYTKDGDSWKPGRVEKDKWKDESNDRKRFQVIKKWHETRLKLNELHRKHGLEMWDKDQQVARRHLQRAIAFEPFDEEAHLKLGHKKRQFGDKAYYGSAGELEFIGNLKALEKFALQLARKEYTAKPLPEIPRELALLGKEFHGAESKHFKVFTRGTQENADNCVKWAERALDFMIHCLGQEKAKALKAVEIQAISAWTGFIWTKYEREDLIRVNLERNKDSEFVKQCLQGARAAEMEATFGNMQWYGKDRKAREITKKLTPASMHDRLVAHVWELGISMKRPGYTPNWALSQGALHAASWYLLSTAMTKLGSLPKGTVGSRDVILPPAVNWWMREMRDQAIAKTDMPLKDAARKQSDAFPSDARLKLWSFMTWLMARYPQQWHDFVMAVPGDKIPFPEEVEKAAEKVFQRKLDDMEVEWRAWASGRSVAAAATGYGPPLLPEEPNPEQVAGLNRLNELRAMAGLAPCELDQEATLACVEHARYLIRYPEHHKWPDAHEQNPAKEGFTPRGMRCGLRSVIVINARGAAESIDDWIGTVYHRFPLLAQNIRRIGFAFEEGPDGAMCVLDMGSLEEPHAVDANGKALEKKWVVWPPDGSTRIDRQFAFYEHPNPLADVPAPNNRDDKAGYPVSLTVADFVQPQLKGASIALYEARKQGKEFVRKDQVRCHVHTPFKPLLSRNEVLDTVFAIPYEPLKKRQLYKVEVKLETKGGVSHVEWTFTTNSKGLKVGNRDYSQDDR